MQERHSPLCPQLLFAFIFAQATIQGGLPDSEHLSRQEFVPRGFSYCIKNCMSLDFTDGKHPADAMQRLVAGRTQRIEPRVYLCWEIDRLKHFPLLRATARSTKFSSSRTFHGQE